ncbi:MAG: glycine cleavage system aminomethyltransferase GcvT [Planctomycetes bacterium]|nr:glycine cleavage system aminomethyltransferase GcvT [Planctomycetota bacterium]
MTNPNASFLFDDEPIDADVRRFIELEEQRQARKLQMIPSESICPKPVLAALGSAFSNKYAEGYPSPRMTRRERDRIPDVERHLAFFRRYSDKRYYKGTEFVDFVEALAQQRCAELFAANGVRAADIFVNVQPLSGAPANNAVYEALCRPGDVVMGMHLSHGGHLTHGSPFNRSGRNYKVTAYVVNEETGKLDYDVIRSQAREVRPKMVVAGASAYPWTIDWRALRAICDEVGARLLADISHPAGLVVAGLFPNPVGVADVTMFTTHKTMCGPRGAVLMSTDREVARRIDSAVFPGEQGGPHANSIAAKAVAFKLAATEKFRALQKRVVENCAALSDGFARRGLPLAFGGTNTHLCVVDLREMEWPGGVRLTADVGSNILDLAGITANKNALPGDATGVRPSGIRFGSVILSQRGMGPKEMDQIAEHVARTLRGIQTFRVRSLSGRIVRGKIDYDLLRDVRSKVAELTSKFAPFPKPESPNGTFLVRGERARPFLDQAAAGNVAAMEVGACAAMEFHDDKGRLIEAARILRRDDGYVVDGSPALREWLSSLSDGYVRISPDDVFAKVHGPVAIIDATPPNLKTPLWKADATKTFYVGRPAGKGGAGKVFEWKPAEEPEKKTPLWAAHKKLGGKMAPFAGWSMPLWYAGAQEEHKAVRTAAGLFDVGHMGTLEVSGPFACDFLDTVTTNFVHRLEVGHSHYSYVLDVDGRVMDDIIVYRTGEERYMVVVNASNQDKIWAWWSAVNRREAIIDREAPEKVAPGPVTLRRLKDPASGADQRVDLALQGPASLEILRKLGAKEAVGLGKFQHVPARVGEIDVLASRTGYTGAEMGFELFVHPDRAEGLWDLLLAQPGVAPCGLGARDSTRTEAGFPLYGHELAGRHDLGPSEAGYGAFVRRHKPFFVGKKALLAKEAAQTRQVARFTMKRKGIKMARPDDPVVNRRGECVGFVTSCAMIDKTQIGMAIVEHEYAAVEKELGVFILPHKERDVAEKAKSKLEFGDRVAVPEEAVVIARFATFG